MVETEQNVGIDFYFTLDLVVGVGFGLFGVEKAVSFDF